MEQKPALKTLFVGERPMEKQLRKSRLLVVDGPDRGSELIIAKERVRGGRASVNDLVLNDKAVSGRHFELIAHESGFLLNDLQSTNGTFCGEFRVQSALLTPGQSFRVGASRVQFESLDEVVSIKLSDSDRFHEVVGRSVPMREIFATLEKVAPSDLTVLVEGETGTGKEKIAHALHHFSGRRAKPFVVQDCGAIPRELVESVLFGHERGAFTGAHQQHRGCFEHANGGTIFLDEIGELDLSLQPKLLRVLETRELKRVGGDKTIKVDVRVVAATNRDLRRMVEEGKFREDLYFRLSIIHVTLPPLRERREDVPLLAQNFLDNLATRKNGEPLSLAPDAVEALCAHDWPGNVRELKNLIERASSLTDGNLLSARDLLFSSPIGPVHRSKEIQEELRGMSFKEAKARVLEDFEAQYLRALLARHGGNLTHASHEAGLTRYHLRELLRKHDLRGDD
jgi:transcriptional regulator with GAF, ATPase, and Fis domain